MKRMLLIVLALGLALSACSSGESIGAGLKNKDGFLESVPPTDKPKPSKSPSKKAEPTERPTTKTPTRKGNTFTIVIRDVNNGYEPRELRAHVGDTVIFRNLDTTSDRGHSFTGDKGEWDSGTVPPNGTWTWKIDIKPGFYTWHDEIVPYLVGGPLEVIAA